jgi:Sulfotransferase family
MIKINNKVEESKLKFPKIHYDIVDNCVMVTGMYRGGTTLTGKLLGSLRNVEYIFEPPLIHHLDYLLQENEIDYRLVAELFRTYLAEDYMLNYLHGRRYNMRPSDDSSIFQTKSYEECVGRWAKINRLRDAIDLYREEGPRLIFKSPAKYTVIPIFLEFYPAFKVVEIVRDLRDVLSSILSKGWFSDENIQDWEYGIWPFAQNNLTNAPYVSGLSDIDDYEKADEETRAIDYINAMMKKRFEITKFVESKYTTCLYSFKYEDLLQNPRVAVSKISNFLQMELTSKTEEIIKTIENRKHAFDIAAVLKGCDQKLVEKFISYNKALGYE